MVMKKKGTPAKIKVVKESELEKLTDIDISSVKWEGVETGRFSSKEKNKDNH
jgi:hypothetical protein